ncbi:10405_t:CDS:2 [Cetraspora pellucida]|uniref:10405_t:CDS:1 n=1 Tax=Cetraspora pellucida TaxID=1433469 RepID=A0A9N9FSJ3_9GLOM|nr:10405_t:CDS:2 [Cetraspora pellucida]
MHTALKKLLLDLFCKENKDILKTIKEQLLTSNKIEVKQNLVETINALIFGPISIK